MSFLGSFVGIFETAIRGLASAFAFAGNYKWAFAIVLFTIIIRSLLLPVAIKQIRSMREQQRLQPEVQRLRQKYKDDRQKMTQEMMALYQREGVNPYAACLPMLAQFPVMLGFYYALRRVIALPHALDVAVKAKKMTLDHAIALAQGHHPPQVPHMPFFGGDLAHSAISSAGGIVLLVLMTVSQILATRQLNPGQTDQQKRMQMLMPLFMVFIFYRFAAALVLYWTTQSIYQYVQQLVMTRSTREKGIRGLLGFESKEKAAADRKRALQEAKLAKKAEKPQVKGQNQPAARPAVAMAGSGSGSLDALAARRGLEEKRQQRRRSKNKKKKRRR